jgi:hypothetical protein
VLYSRNINSLFQVAVERFSHVSGLIVVQVFPFTCLVANVLLGFENKALVLTSLQKDNQVVNQITVKRLEVAVYPLSHDDVGF